MAEIESEIAIPWGRSDQVALGLWRAASLDTVAIVFHGAPGYSFYHRDRWIADALFDLEVSILRVQFVPREWRHPPSRRQFLRYRLPIARGAIRWVRERCPSAKIILAGGSFGAMLSARLADCAKTLAVILVSPPVVDPRRGTPSYARWAGPLKTSGVPKLVVLGSKDAEWGPLNTIRAAMGKWADPKALKLIRGAGHDMRGYEEPLKIAIRTWASKYCACPGNAVQTPCGICLREPGKKADGPRRPHPGYHRPDCVR